MRRQKVTCLTIREAQYLKLLIQSNSNSFWRSKTIRTLNKRHNRRNRLCLTILICNCLRQIGNFSKIKKAHKMSKNHLYKLIKQENWIS